jgi:CRISPR system Cascade subunit CasB
MPQPEPTAVRVKEEGGLAEAFADCVRALNAAERRGDLAELRRLDPERPSSPAYFRIVTKVAPDSPPPAMRRFGQLLQILALKPEALIPWSLGKTMAEAGISESRVQRLLSARGSTFDEQVRLIARRLANFGRLPYREIGRLLLAREESEEIEEIRLRIARDYWRALDRRAVIEADAEI